jgi:hypothetical protein
MIRFPLEGQGETSSWRATTSPPGRFIGLAGVNGGSVFVVVWEPRHGRGGGHQLVLEPDKAEKLRRQMSRERPDDGIRIETAEAYGAAAVVERGQRHRPRDGRR